jgi:hypothetical protein
MAREQKFTIRCFTHDHTLTLTIPNLPDSYAQDMAEQWGKQGFVLYQNVRHEVVDIALESADTAITKARLN